MIITKNWLDSTHKEENTMPWLMFVHRSTLNKLRRSNQIWICA